MGAKGARVDSIQVRALSSFRDRVDVLRPRYRKMMLMRYGMSSESNEPMTLEAIAQDFGITRERVRQIIKRSWHIMHGPYQRKLFRDSIKEALRSDGKMGSRAR